jgi:hypothetical protein
LYDAVGKRAAPTAYTPLVSVALVRPAVSGYPIASRPQKYWAVVEYPPFGAWYEATYEVPATTATGVASWRVCHPDTVAPGKVPVATWVPAALQIEPVC